MVGIFIVHCCSYIFYMCQSHCRSGNMASCNHKYFHLVLFHLPMCIYCMRNWQEQCIFDIMGDMLHKFLLSADNTLLDYTHMCLALMQSHLLKNCSYCIVCLMRHSMTHRKDGTTCNSPNFHWSNILLRKHNDNYQIPTICFLSKCGFCIEYNYYLIGQYILGKADGIISI